MNPQYKKGVIELCVLSILRRRDCYGYEIAEKLSGKIDISGTAKTEKGRYADNIFIGIQRRTAEEVLLYNIRRLDSIRTGQSRIFGICEKRKRNIGGWT